MGISLGLIGYPAKHSLSPWIHQRFMETAKIKGSYNIFEIAPDEFDKEVKNLKTMDLQGFNVTVPFKQKIIPYLDQLDPDAKRTGAVNTVIDHDGKWIGYNTDGKGYIRSLKSAYPEVISDDKRVLILGAGGAARGIYRALVTENMKQVDIANRTISKANLLLELGERTTETFIFTMEEAKEKLRDYDLIIQTTNVGMKPNSKEQPIPLTTLKKGTVVSDIVYQPLQTAFLQDAKSHGGFTHMGHTMLLYQAQYAFELWTNQKVEVELMDRELEQRLKGFET
ncbi:shikimate dehydrogenase [Aquibacillus sp. 3ASR75-11]|uniref:Shikimate dehydrogenase (NADP(+)) n=1 Tax=Terrihalobacillus insolitus TaxID=2950438 RepID=A0A9X4AMJ3_9BACI|nr:shikimate dehydrogenase [Terrihalobacillus insolitus]MDC3413316.1 shikimate dehydrogenase [Terrihalobacillus insolitus]MDC3424899.1 shikimate dehydrogenase [Terrihalobacillus insolitus]